MSNINNDTIVAGIWGASLVTIILGGIITIGICSYNDAIERTKRCPYIVEHACVNPVSVQCRDAVYKCGY